MGTWADYIQLTSSRGYNCLTTWMLTLAWNLNKHWRKAEDQSRLLIFVLDRGQRRRKRHWPVGGVAGVRVRTGCGHVVTAHTGEAGHGEVVVTVGAGVGAVGGGRVAREGGQGVAGPGEGGPVCLHHLCVPGQGQVTASLVPGHNKSPTGRSVSFLSGYKLETVTTLGHSGQPGCVWCLGGTELSWGRDLLLLTPHWPALYTPPRLCWHDGQISRWPGKSTDETFPSRFFLEIRINYKWWFSTYE